MQNGNAKLGMVTGAIIGVVAIVAVVVLVALGKVDASTGVTLIGTLAGVHGGAAVANTSNR